MGQQEKVEMYKRGKMQLGMAIEADERQAYDRAIQMYTLACESFLAGFAHDTVQQSRVKIIEAVKGYLSRAEYLAEATKVQSYRVQHSSGKTGNRSRKSALQSRSVSESQRELVTQAKESAKEQDPREEGLKSVAGLSKVKQALREAVILPMVHPKLFVGARKPWKGILLYGPPGTGKTHVVEALSKEAKFTFLSISSSDLVSKHVGESERAVRKLFEKARSSRPCVIFIDEVDAVGMSREKLSGSNAESSRRMLTEILKQMDGVGSDMEGITVIAATNHPFDIDPALRRRFERRIFVPMPGLKSRARMLKMMLGSDKSVCNISKSELLKLAQKTKGFSGADLAAVANEALMIPIRKCLRATHFKEVSEDELGENASLWKSVSRVFSFFSSSAKTVLVPCSPFEAGAKRMNIMEDGFPASKLRVPPIKFADLEAALAAIKPSVDASELQQYQEFANSFGDKLASMEDDAEEEEEEEEEIDSVTHELASAAPLPPAQFPSRSSQTSSRALVPG